MKAMHRIFLLIFLLLLCACTGAEPTAPASPTPTFAVSKLGTVERDIPYCEMDGTNVLLDVFYPEKGKGPWPVLMHVHGGGWSSGSKNNSFLFPKFTELGVLGVEVGYRLSPEVQFPAHIEDVKCAVRYLKAHAAEYNLDPERILAVGESAGGHLVSLLGVTGDSGEFNDTGQWLEYSADVKAVVAISAPTDLDSVVCWSSYTAQLSAQVFGAGDQCGTQEPILLRASPTTYVSAGDTPFMLISGTADPVVPFQQAEKFHNLLLEAGVDSNLLLIEGGDHGLQVPDDPNAVDKALRKMLVFIAKQLEISLLPGW